MAYCRLSHIKENKGAGGMAAGLKNCIDYIFNPKKTENMTLIGGYNLMIDASNPANSAFEQMLATKSVFGKEAGRQGYHYKLSFATSDNLTPELAMEITNEFCRRCFGAYECAYSVHTNTAHLHSHIVFNSIDIANGYKYRYGKGDWANKIQPIANEICKEYGLSELDLNLDEELRLKNKCMDYGKWKKKNNYSEDKPLSYTNKMIRADVDECVKNATSYEEFKTMMEAKGHRLNDSGKHLTILAPGRTRPCRSYILSSDKSTYTKENIERMIQGTYLSTGQIKEKLFASWDAYVVERTKVVAGFVKTIRLSPELAKEMENRSFQVQHKIHDIETLKFYQYQLEQMDKQLNIMKKHIRMSYDMERENIELVSELISLIDDFYKYQKTGSARYEAAYDKANEIYRKLCDRRIGVEELFLFDQKSRQILQEIDEYKKHIFVEKKICGRLEKELEPQKPQKPRV